MYPFAEEIRDILEKSPTRMTIRKIFENHSTENIGTLKDHLNRMVDSGTLDKDKGHYYYLLASPKPHPIALKNQSGEMGHNRKKAATTTRPAVPRVEKKNPAKHPALLALDRMQPQRIDDVELKTEVLNGLVKVVDRDIATVLRAVSDDLQKIAGAQSC